MKRKQMISVVLAGTLTTSSLSMYAQPVITVLPQIEIQDDVQTTTSPAIEIAPEDTLTEDKPTVLPLLPEDYEAEANKPVTLPMTPEDYEKMESVPLEQTQLEVNEEGYTVIQYNEGTLQQTIEGLGIEFPEKLKLEGSQLLTEEDFAYMKEYAVYLDLSDINVVDNRIPDFAFSLIDLENKEEMPNEKLLKIILPSTITSVGDFSFAGCTSLMSIDIPNKVSSIGASAFFACTELKEVNLPESLISIGDTAFAICMSLESIKIPKGVKFIGEYVFVDIKLNPNTHLKVYKDSVGEKYAKANGLSYELTIDYLTIEKIDTIQLNIPYNYKDKEKLKVYTKLYTDNGMTYIVPYELDLSEVNFETEEVQTIKETISLNEVDILGLNKEDFVLTPNTIDLTIAIQVIPEVQLEGVIKSISNLEIETVINEPATLPLVIDVVLTNDEKVTLPVEWDTTFLDLKKADTYILDGTFILPESIQNPRNLKPQLTVKVVDPSAVTENPLEDFVIDEEGKLTAYLGDSTYVVIPENVKTIGEQVFMNNQTIEIIVLPSGLRTIENEAFKNATNIKEIVFNEGLETISNSAFKQCIGLESIKLPKSLIDLGNGVFAECTNLVGIDLGSNLTTIKEGTFYNCKSLEYVIGMDNIKTIKDLSFYNCIVLNKIDLENITEIGNQAFYSTSIEELSFNQLKTLGELAFAYNGSLRKLDFGNSPLKMIPNGAFKDCSNLLEINFSNQIKIIDQGAFQLSYYQEIPRLINDRTSVNNDLILNFPESLKFIGERAFYNNFNVREVNFSNSCYIGDDILNNDIFVDDIEQIKFSGDIIFIEDSYNKPPIFIDHIIIDKNINQLDFDLYSNKVTVLDSVSSINLDLFSDVDMIDIPKTVTSIELDFDPYYIDAILMVEENSYAHQFAIENELNYVLKDMGESDFAIKDGVLEAYIGDLNADTIIIPEGVISIQSGAFYNVKAKEIILPNSLEEIRFNAFLDANIDKLTINPKKNLSLDEDFANSANIGLLELYIDRLEIENPLELDGKIKMLNIYTDKETLRENDIKINVYSNLDKFEIISNNLSVIESNSLDIDSKKVVFNEGLARIENNIFSEYSTVSEVIMPETLAFLGNMPNIKKVVFPENSSIEILESNVFKDNRFETLELPKSITTIKNNAFDGGLLKNLIIPESVVTIEDDAFINTSKDFMIITPENSVAWQFAKDKGINHKSIEDYQANLFEIENNILVKYHGKEKIVYVPEGVKGIGYNAFTDNTEIEEVYLPETTSSISSSAFKNALNLKKVEASSVQQISNDAFYNTPNLTEFIGNKLSYIGKRAFYGSGIKNIDLTNVISIGKQAFYDSGIVNVKTGKNLNNLYYSAFMYCKDLVEVDLEESSNLDEIYSKTFAYNPNLQTVSLPKNLKKLGIDVFMGSGVRKIKLPLSFEEFIFDFDSGPSFLYEMEDFEMEDFEMEDRSNVIYIVPSNHPNLEYLRFLYQVGLILLEIEDELKVIDIEKYPMMNILKGTDKESLVLPETVRYYLNNGKAVDLSILEWDLSEVDTSQKGSYIVKGTTNLNEILKEQPDNEALRIIQSQKKFEPLLKINVIPNGKEIVDLLSANEVYREEKLNTPFEALNLPTEANVLLDNGEAVTLKVNWNPLDYNPQQLGEQVFYGTLDLEDQYLNEKGLKVKATVKLLSNATEKPDVPDEPHKPTTPSKPVEKPLEVIKPAIHKVPLVKLEPALISSPLIPLNPSQTVKEELPVLTPSQEEKPLERPIEKPIDKPQDEDTNTQQKVDSTNNNVDKNTSNKQPAESDMTMSISIQEWVEIEPSLPIQTLEDTQFEQKEDVTVPQVPISENVIVNEDSEQPTNRFYEQVKKLFPNMSYNTFMILSTSIGFVLVAAIFILVIYINKKRKEKENE